MNEYTIDNIKDAVAKATLEVCEAAKLKEGGIFVVGCSSSEILGQRIGTFSSPEVGEAVIEAVLGVLRPRGIFLAAQCCEHLNRALITEKAAAQRYLLSEVNVVPQPKAGGSFATAAYKAFDAPTAVEEVRADAGMDIGGTLIGMHLKRVAVPIKLKTRTIGDAVLTAARTRLPFTGGARAVYDESLM